MIECRETAAGKVLTDGCLGGGKDTPTSTHTPKPTHVWLLSWPASIS